MAILFCVRSCRSHLAAISSHTSFYSLQWSRTMAESSYENARPYQDIPGPKPIPILGNVWRFIPGIGNLAGLAGKDLFPRLMELYGPIVKLGRLFGKPDIVFVTDPESTAIIMRTEGEWPVREGTDVITYYFQTRQKETGDGMYQSLVALQGKEWGAFRSAVNPVMMLPKSSKRYTQPISEVAREFIEKIVSLRDDQLQVPGNFTKELQRWALESATYVALDTRLHLITDLPPDSEPMKIVEAANGIIDSLFELDFLPSPWKYVSTPNFRKFMSSMDYFRGVASKHVFRAVERLKSTSPEELSKRECSVLEKLLLSTNDPSKAVSMSMDMLLAGVDTTSTLVSTVLYQLATHPDKQIILQQELDKVCPDPSQHITTEQLDQLRYLKACVKEANRVEPVTPANARSAGQDIVLHGYQIPKGTRLVTMHMIMTKQESNFPRANEFLPERWLRENEDLRAKNPFAYLPFGFGPRMCVGKRFAELEVEILLSTIFRNYTLEWNHPPPKTDIKLTLVFESPMKFTMKERK